MTAAPTLAQEQIHSVPLKLLDESPFNRRHRWGSIQELADSFKGVGIVQPLTARRIGERFELVFGHRRFRAAKLAKLDTAPCIVRILTDAQVLEMQAIENIQREDPHPLDEAESFEQLMKLGWSVDQLAAKIGKSRSYIFARMKLLDLGPEAREAFYGDRLLASVAILLARVPQGLQGQALKDIDQEALEIAENAFHADPGVKDGDTRREASPDPIGQRAAAAVLRSKYMLRLADAPFDKGDVDLVAGVGACAACPKRSGNQTELFADVASPDVCTDPLCFGSKKTATAAAQVAKLETKGVRVLPGKERTYGGVSAPTGWVSLEERCPETGKTYGEMAKGKKVAMAIAMAGRVVMLDERNKPVDIVKRADVLEAAGVDTTKAADRGAPTPEQQARQDMKVDAELAGEAAALTLIVGKVEKDGLSDALMRLLVPQGSAIVDAAKRRGWKIARESWNTDCSSDLKKLSGKALAGVLVEVMVGRQGIGEAFDEACKLFKVDVKALTAKELEKLKAAAKGEPEVGPKADKPKAKKPAKKGKR